MKQEPICNSGRKWLKEVASNEEYCKRIGLSRPCKVIFAPFTGQDSQAYSVFLHALNLYCYSDGDGARHALLCMKHAVLAMQESVRWIARESIPHSLDWSDTKTLWPKILAAAEFRERHEPGCDCEACTYEARANREPDPHQGKEGIR